MADNFFLNGSVNIKGDADNIDEEAKKQQIREATTGLLIFSLCQELVSKYIGARDFIDPDDRIHMLKKIASTTDKRPIEKEWPMREKVKALAESLGCSYEKTFQGYTITRIDDVAVDLTVSDGQVHNVEISLCEGTSFFSPEATELLFEDQWTDFRNRLAKRLPPYDVKFNRMQKEDCIEGMGMLRNTCQKYAPNPNYTTINNSPYGYFLPPDDMRQGRFYYLINPFYRDMSQTDRTLGQLTPHDYDSLPYIEVGFVKDGSKSFLPEYNSHGIWASFITVNATIRLKLSKGVLISASTRKKLGELSPKNLSVQHYTNSYRYLTGDTDSNNFRMVTQFDDGKPQHVYNVNATLFDKADDSIITEIYIQRLSDFPLVIAYLRSETMHMNLWKSMLSACCKNEDADVQSGLATKFNVHLEREQITIICHSPDAPFELQILENSGTTVVEIKSFVLGGNVCELEKKYTDTLNETWSIPQLLNVATNAKISNPTTFTPSTADISDIQLLSQS